MYSSILLAVFLAMGMAFVPGGGDRDDIMTMHGGRQDGKTRINAFQTAGHSFAAGGYRFEDYPTGAVAAPGVSVDARYLEWKNNCVPMTPVVQGKRVALTRPHGFEQVSPYIMKLDPEAAGYIDLLVEELEQ